MLPISLTRKMAKAYAERKKLEKNTFQEQYKQDLEQLSREQLIERVLILNELCALWNQK